MSRASSIATPHRRDGSRRARWANRAARRPPPAAPRSPPHAAGRTCHQSCLSDILAKARGKRKPRPRPAGAPQRLRGRQSSIMDHGFRPARTRLCRRASRMRKRSPMTNTLPKRADVPEQYTWDLTVVYSDNNAWEQDFASLPALLDEFESYQGRARRGRRHAAGRNGPAGPRGADPLPPGSLFVAATRRGHHRRDVSGAGGSRRSN